MCASTCSWLCTHPNTEIRDTYYFSVATYVASLVTYKEVTDLPVESVGSSSPTSLLFQAQIYKKVTTWFCTEEFCRVYSGTSVQNICTGQYSVYLSLLDLPGMPFVVIFNVSCS